MLSSFLGKKKDESLDNVRIESYFELLKTLIYGNANWQSVVRQIKNGSKGMGVCAKVLKAGDVAWKCEDCEKDSTCIICQECFEKSNHKGHRVWLKTNVGGCCDCGDPDAWDEHGFCSDHKGFAASSEAMLSQLPKQVRDNSPIVFSSLAKSLKGVLLDLITGQDKDELQKVVAKIFLFYEQSALETISDLERDVEELKASSFTKKIKRVLSSKLQYGVHKFRHYNIVQQNPEQQKINLILIFFCYSNR